MIPLFPNAQNRYDILITEFLPDPSPSVGLPESSFIELTNHSGRNYNLRNWKISNGSATSVIKPDYILKADSCLILCPASYAADFNRLGPALGISGFPSMNNNDGDIILTTDASVVMHALHYDRSWFNNEIKGRGGWSLEMIDLSNPCTTNNNWTASVSLSGGTPGYKNSVSAENPDSESPSLIRSTTVDSLNVILIFDEPVDSTTTAFPSNYFISDGIGSPASANALDPFFDQVEIHLQKPMAGGKIYTISLQHILDCSGNEISLRNNCKAGMPEKLKPGDIIFNEILFNPPPYGYDYIELYNRSSATIACSGLYLAGRDVTGNLKDPVPIVKEERSFFPGEYLLLTENPAWVLHNYPMADPVRTIALSGMPSMPDDLGKIVLLNTAGDVIDELHYDHHWHSPLLADESGVALERIHSDDPTSLASNWISASAPSGYGTPGYKNSEYSADSAGTDLLSLDPNVFSPDMDGYQDFLYIRYHLPAAGFIGSISVYDIYGRMVRKLVNNILWGTAGSFRWDGLDDKQNLLPMGHYVMYIELFLPEGRVIKKKLVCVLARHS
ncbi:MAG TPA: hypothetical protein VIL90_01840 [Puia sp.]